MIFCRKRAILSSVTEMNMIWKIESIVIIHGGIRTHDLWIRSPARYPLRYADLNYLVSLIVMGNLFQDSSLKQKLSPHKGLEPLTVGLKVQRSTD